MKAVPLVLVCALLGVAIGVAVGYARIGPSGEVNLSPSGTAAGPGLNTAAPKIVVEEPEHDFGTMHRGAKRRHEYVIRNEGDAPLNLTAGATTCKCTSFDVTPDAIPPGQSATIALEWAAKSMPGEFRQSASLNTNDPIRPMVTLSVSGQVIEPSGLTPSGFELGEIRAGDTATASVLFYSNDIEDLRLSADGPKKDDGSDLFDIVVEPVSKDQLPRSDAVAGYRTTLTTKPGLAVGPVNEWVKLKTNQPDSEELEVPVFARVVGDITVHGGRWNDTAGALHLGMVPSSKGAESRVLISVKGSQAANTRFEVLEVDPPELKVELGETTRKSDEVYHTFLTIEVPPGTRPMIHLNNDQGDEGVVRLKTTHPLSPELKIGVRFAVTQ
jgi:hypothetical protein